MFDLEVDVKTKWTYIFRGGLKGEGELGSRGWGSTRQIGTLEGYSHNQKPS